MGWPSFAWLAQLALEMVPGVVAKNGKASYVDMVDGSQLLFDCQALLERNLRATDLKDEGANEPIRTFINALA